MPSRPLLALLLCLGLVLGALPLARPGLDWETGGARETVALAATVPDDVVQPAVEAQIAPKVAYIVRDSSAGSAGHSVATSWKTLLDGAGYPTDILDHAQAAAADLTAYSLVVVGYEPSVLRGEPWGSSSLVSKLANVPGRVLAVGSGGMAFLKQAGLITSAIITPEGTSVAVRLPCFVPALSYPRSIPLATAADFSNIYQPDKPSNVTRIPAASWPQGFYPLASDTTSPSDWTGLRIGDKTGFWGYEGSPANMTAAGADLTLNLIEYFHQSLPVYSASAVDTVIVSNCTRMTQLGYARADVYGMMAKLQALVSASPADTRMVAVHVDLANVAGMVGPAADWAGLEGEVPPTNAFVDAIDSWLESRKQSTYTNLKNVVIVGGHEVIPMQARPVDNYNESGWDLPGSTGYLYDLHHTDYLGHYLTDTPYGDLSYYNDGWGQYGVLRPELAVGRLVETPLQISGLVDNYVAAKGTLTRARRLSAGSNDFVDGARMAADAMGTGTETSLIKPTWNSNDLSPLLNEAPNIVFLAGHGDYNGFSTGAGFYSTGINDTEGHLGQVGDLPNAVVVADGCHNGVNLGNMLYRGPDPDGSARFRDFPEEFAARGAGIYVGATGYTWVSISGASENVADVAASEKLAALFVEHLLHDGNVNAGKSWLKAFDEYLGGVNSGLTDGGDRRVLATTSFYGFPTYGWNISNLIAKPELTKPVDFWWKWEKVFESRDTVKYRYTLRLPARSDPVSASSIRGLDHRGSLEQPVRPMLSFTPVLPPGTAVRAWALDSAQSRSRVVSGQIPLLSMGNSVEAFQPRWSSPEFSPAEPVATFGGGAEPIRVQVSPVQHRGTTEPGAGAVAAASGETQVWEELVFTVEYAPGPSDDVDGDGLPGYWEEAFGLDPENPDGTNGASGDPDMDGLDNAQEYALETDPLDPDSDDDGAPDGWEVGHGIDPHNPGEHWNAVYVPLVLRPN